MNIQTERLDNHMARLTVEVEPDRWNSAKQTAARKLSQRLSIPGFRKGKAPYNVVLRYVGEPAIIEDAIEILGNDIYRSALDEAAIEPYTTGSLEDFRLEPAPTYVFSVPLQPEVKLNDYRSIRLEYTAPEITDEDVNQAMTRLQREEAVVEESSRPATVGDRVTADVHANFADGPEPDEADETEDVDEAARVPRKGDVFAHQHQAVLDLDPNNEPFLPGFIDALIGAESGSTVEFELSVPETEEYSEEARGRKVNFSVEIAKIENVTLPELNDELAARITKEEEKPLTLLELRMRVRENMEKQALDQANRDYANQVLDQAVDQAEMAYPEAMVKDRIEEMLKDLDSNLRQQGISLEDYLRITSTERSTVEEQYRANAEQSVRRSLALGEVIVQERLIVTAEEVAARINDMIASFGDSGERLRSLIDTPRQRESLASNVLYEKVMDRLAAIGKGEAPELVAEEIVVEEQSENPVADDETAG